MKRIFYPLILAALLCGCTTLVTDGTGAVEKNGAYTTKKICGITYSHKPKPTRSEATEAAIVGFLFWVAVAAFAGVLVGAVSWMIDQCGAAGVGE